MAHELLTITVNGVETQVPPGEMLLDSLRNLGIVVPTLCHDDRLRPYGGCRLCVVARRDGRGGLVATCSTPVQRGMVIETDAPEVIESRRQQLQLLVLNHRMECPVCERRGDCRLQDLIYEYGSPEDELPFRRQNAPIDRKSRVIVRDPEKCIVCGRCVRICDEVQGVAAIGIINRGLEARVATLLERPLDCEFCGQCVNACPVGALVARPYASEVPVWQRQATITTCSYCSCGCEIKAETHEGSLQRITSNVETPPNHGKLCPKGWLGWDVYRHPDRLEAPLLRRDGQLVEVSWNEALDAVAAVMREAREAKRPVVGLGSSRLTCEDAYLLQRFVRSVMGSPHVDLGPVGGVGALVDGMGGVSGAPHSSATFEDLAAADVVLVLRGDPTRTHPLVKTELVQGIRQRGQKLVLAHALSGGLERHAEVYLPLEPGTEEVLVHGLAAEVLRRRPRAADGCGAVTGFTEWSAGIADYTPDVVSATTGIPAERIAGAAELLAAARKVVAVVVTGLGIPGEESGVTRAAAHLMRLLGDCEGRAGVLVMGEKANVQGVLDVGLHPFLLPGHRKARQQDARRQVGEVWGCELPHGPGWTTKEIFSRAAHGEIDVLHVVGQDPVGAWPQALEAPTAIEATRFVVVQDAFLTRTARNADAVLPVRILGDRDGTLVGADGVRRSLRRVGMSKGFPQDGQIFVELARRLGSELPEGERLDQELARLIRWPHEKPSLARFEAVTPPIRRPSWSGMLLDVSPQLFHSGSVTRRSSALQELSPTVAARLSPTDAGGLGVQNGDTIRVTAGKRELLLRARLDRTVRRGTVVVPWLSGTGESASPLVVQIGEPLAVTIRRP
jgi:predicted molibdopterin-dependent oxidoreductase YjgC